MLINGKWYNPASGLFVLSKYIIKELIKPNNIEISNSTFDRGSVTSYYAGMYIYGGYKHVVRDNVVTSFNIGINTYYDTYGSYYYNNYVHNNTGNGMYMYYSSYFSYPTDPTRIVKNKFVDNNNGLYRGDSNFSIK